MSAREGAGQGRSPVLILTAVIVVSLVGATIIYLLPQTAPDQGFRLEFARTGGIAGTNDTMTVTGDGHAALASRFGASFNATVPPVELSELKRVVTTNLQDVSPRTFSAKAGAADYFAYRLVVTTGGQTTQLDWVDQWAVNGSLPLGLSTIQGELEKLSADVTFRSSYGNSNTTEAGALRMTVLTDEATYTTGGQVDFAVILENTGSSNVTYKSPTPCAPDVKVAVSGSSGTIEITTNDTQPCVQVIQERTLAGSSYLVQEGTWNVAGGVAGASPGSYTVRATFPYASFEKTLVSSAVEISVRA